MIKGKRTTTFILREKYVPPSTVNGTVTARNLPKSDLAGVIFGCKHSTIRECFSNKIFGLPAPHFSYIKNIDPGLPLFLFNYSDRKLHGIFEAKSRGQLNIDSVMWTADGSDSTPYAAQVRFETRLPCQPLLEDQFQPIIAENYFHEKHFWFELDRYQTSKLISLFSSSPITSLPMHAMNLKGSHDASGWNKSENIGKSNGNETDWGCVSMSNYLDITRESMRAESLTGDIVAKDSGHLVPYVTSSLPRSYSTVVKTGIIPSVDTAQHNIKHGSSLDQPSDGWDAYEHQSIPSSSSFGATLYCFDGELQPSDACVDKATTKMEEDEGQYYNSDAAMSFCSGTSEMMQTEADAKLQSTAALFSQMNCSDLHSMVAKVLSIVEQLHSTQSIQVQKIDSLERQLIESKMEILRLKDQSRMFKPLACPRESETGCSEFEEFKLVNDIYPNFDDVIFVAGGYDGSSWLSDLNAYFPSLDLMKPLNSMTSIRANAAASKLNNELYILGGEDGKLWHDSVESYNSVSNQWTSCPCLSRRKGSLASIAWYDKIFAMGGGDGIECFAEVETLDVSAGRWISVPPMLYKRFGPAAAQISGVLYLCGGYDGRNFLNSVERFDPRENCWKRLQSMKSKRGFHCLSVLKEKLYAIGGYNGSELVPTMEVFDPRVGSWILGEPMNNTRGHFGSVVMEDTIYAIGGMDNDGIILETVEQYKDGRGWEVTNLKAIGKRCYFAAML